MKTSSEMRQRARVWLADRREGCQNAIAIAERSSLVGTLRERERFIDQLRADLEVIDYLAGLVDGGYMPSDRLAAVDEIEAAARESTERSPDA